MLGPLWRFNLDFHERADDAKGKIVRYRNLAALRRTIAPVVLRRPKGGRALAAPRADGADALRRAPEEQKELEESYRRTAAMLVKVAERRPLSPAEQKRLQAALLKARQACNTARL